LIIFTHFSQKTRSHFAKNPKTNLTFFQCHFIKPMMTQLFLHLTKTVFLTILKIPLVAVLPDQVIQRRKRACRRQKVKD